MPIPTNYSSPLRISAKDRALAQLQKWIIEGTLQPGEKLIDGELADALGVSRTPIREALQLLEVQGLVQMLPSKETRVTMIEEEDMPKLYAPLVALHALAAELAVPHIQPEHITRLSELNAQFAKCIQENKPYEALEYDEEFHNVILELADNAYIQSFTSSLQMHIRRYKYLFIKRPASIAQVGVKEHQAIIDALEARDAEAASLMMKKNVSIHT
ncbi:GntR family transcriptional regulator [Paenibacillus sp. BIHB 4019]|uniref:GntR family transcriptional regulator n=1 Tax=Paenibacillus sp. BIHB 4019 TaxID=1870819 RepID=A0A1B2DIJ9_9BACL|nr:GntR family transcriptional regulator [Paenibacillus sp. BIHB 4019]ANY67542.1 GntR family transcriptional regulator [Paenibacillus sp. BIHB 4019]